MDPPQQPVALEGGQIPPDGLGGDVEHGSQLGDIHPALASGLLDDELVTLFGVHVVSPL
jgi:hypothetical protein